jgi:PAS domain S-box-containing protein
MPDLSQLPLLDLDEDAVIRMILEGTAMETGEQFFKALVENLAKGLTTDGAMVTQCRNGKRELETFAFWMDGEFAENFCFDITGTPCEQVINQCSLIHFPDRLFELFPADHGIADAGLVSYLGMPLLDVSGEILGHLAVIDRRPMPKEPRGIAIFRIFAARAAAELQRLRREAEIRDREEKLGCLVDSAMDSILELDDQLRIHRLNSAAAKVFGESLASTSSPKDFGAFLSHDSRRKLLELMGKLQNSSDAEQHLWIPDGLTAHGAGGDEFPAEATLSRFVLGDRSHFTLILRNVNDRYEAERKIRTLTVETEYLREELKSLHNFEEILGNSRPLRTVLQAVRQVAPTSATVLLFGETGTGKELVARAVHSASPRHEHPLIKVNCAAIPANLIESEFFGHEKGAFTGATQRRDGRFALADGGTIFLDEIGELPLDLQGKLLRVLQEGEFEPVGSSKTRKVDVRVIAATNRRLEQAVQVGEFRKDLYYRLNVFPIHLPPLRDRREDIPLLAAAFAERFARKFHKPMAPLTPGCVSRLQSYNWPGNIRELENVIERAVITSERGELDLTHAVPGGSVPPSPHCSEYGQTFEETRIYTIQELHQQERDNILRALEKTHGKVAGPQGAAQLLGINPSTLNSRIRALGLRAEFREQRRTDPV